MSLTAEPAYGKTEYGSHVGVVRTLVFSQTTAKFYVNGTNIQNLTQVIVLATVYNTTCKYFCTHIQNGKDHVSDIMHHKSI